ncbi:MipA/OmpV family protein, partial [Roseobacter sp.]|uniref:MipA/OmpV family protein n=1 Tax=Roseobacter sp. TaxID=1907202 RepID=UPI00385FF18F
LAPRFASDFPSTSLFEGLNRDTVIEVGFSVGCKLANELYAQASFLCDIPTSDGGYEAPVQMGKTLFAWSAELDASVGLRYRDRNLNSYLIGVTPAEPNSIRNAYAAGSTLIPNAQLSANAALIGTLSYEHFGTAYAESPLVESRRVASEEIAIMYQF